MTPDEMERKMSEYEGLVISTVRYWRHMITTDMDDEDVAQELRMKVWRALETFDPDRGYPERNHVFGAVRNRVKDLIGKKRRENFECSLVDDSSGDDDWIAGSQRESAIVLSKYEQRVSTDLIEGLPRMEQRVAILMVQGFNAPEISREININISSVRSHIARVRAHVSLLLAERSQS